MTDEQTVQQDGWAEVGPNRAPSPILYMDTLQATEFAAFYKQHTYTLLKLTAGLRVLDVGCGPGDDVRQIAHMVGPNIDRSGH